MQLRLRTKLTLVMTGLVLLVLAAANMLNVKRRMAEHALRVDKLRRRLL